MREIPISRADLLCSLPSEWPQDPFPEIQRHVRAADRKVAVLDDDPTGTQTVHSTPVLTEWPVEALRAELANDLPAFYLLTNSRSWPLAEAEAMMAEINYLLANYKNIKMFIFDDDLFTYYREYVQKFCEA